MLKFINQSCLFSLRHLATQYLSNFYFQKREKKQIPATLIQKIEMSVMSVQVTPFSYPMFGKLHNKNAKVNLYLPK